MSVRTVNNEQTIKSWLFICVVLILSMVAVGGYTRLTRSGLSITEWRPITGTVPPMNEVEWGREFQKYQVTPEFKVLNHQMTLSHFKKIFIIEYLHRLLGRVIFFTTLIPLLIFRYRGIIMGGEFRKLVLIFLLIPIQGLIGWLMVKSGLQTRPYINGFFLSFHLTFALLIIFLIFEAYQNWGNENQKSRRPFLVRLLLILIALQIFFGGLVASDHILGMCESNDFGVCGFSPWKIFTIDFAFISFYTHKLLGFSIFFYVLCLTMKLRPINYLIAVILSVGIQIVLGYLSVKYNGEFLKTFALLHQLNAFILFLVASRMPVKVKAKSIEALRIHCL